jgi:hypothetical protein
MGQTSVDCGDSMIQLGRWHKDDMGDYVIEVENPNTKKAVRGRIVRCPMTSQYRQRFWRTKNRWLLLVNDHQYGFWNKLSEAIMKFGKDCVAKSKAVPVDDLDDEYYCWHGDKPFGPGPYCTGCGGLIKK